MIIGDLNARTGVNEGYISYKNTVRKSEDVMVNNEGNKVLDLCNSYGLSIVNGCTMSDIDGNYTFIGRQGCSVIDYCLIGIEWENNVTDLKVDLQDYSDHLPLIVDVNFKISNGNAEANSEQKLKPKITWNLRQLNQYNLLIDRRINSTSDDLKLSEIDVLIQESYEECIRGRRPISRQNKRIPKEPWFDRECERKRNQKFFWLNIWRREGSRFYLDEYHRAAKEFKELCYLKKCQFAQNRAIEFCSVRDSSSFWKLAKELNSKKTLLNPRSRC